MPNKKNHLGHEERFFIEKLLKANTSLIIIAGILGRSLSTISQEIKKNGGKTSYKAQDATIYSITKQSRKKEKYNKLALNKSLREFVLVRLKRGLSPEIISMMLKKSSKKRLGYASAKSIRKYIKQINNKHI